MEQIIENTISKIAASCHIGFGAVKSLPTSVPGTHWLQSTFLDKESTKIPLLLTWFNFNLNIDK